MTTIDAPAPVVSSRSGRRYAEPGRRDLRLDLIRGYALAAMAVNHFGLHQSYVHTVSGRSSFLISAAEVFLVVSGYTLGVVSLARGADAGRKLLRRTGDVYLATVGISLGLSAVAMATTLQLWGEFEPGAHAGPLQWLGRVLTMTGSFNGADILITYVVYLGVAVGAVALMRRGRTDVVVGATVGVYALGVTTGIDPLLLGIHSFRALFPNAPLFFGGLVLGYHRPAIGRWWDALPVRPALDVAVLVIVVGLGTLHATGWPVLDGLGLLITGGEPAEPLGVREYEMPLAALIVVGLYLRAIWFIADRAWGLLQPVLGRLLLPMGQAGLFTFVMHLVAIPVVVNLPGFSDDGSRLVATLWVLLFLTVLRGSVELHRMAGAWLADRPGFVPRARSARPLLVAAAMAVAVLAVGSTVAADQWGVGGTDIDEDGERFVDEEGFVDGDAAPAPTSS